MHKVDLCRTFLQQRKFIVNFVYKYNAYVEVIWTIWDIILVYSVSKLSHCKYSENSMTELHENWWTSAILYAEHSH